MPDPVTGIMGGASLIGGVSQANAASDAADAQAAAAERDLQFQRETRDLVFSRLNPWFRGGKLANAALLYEMGLGPRPMIGGNTLTVEEIAGRSRGGSAQPATSPALSPTSWQNVGNSDRFNGRYDGAAKRPAGYPAAVWGTLTQKQKAAVVRKFGEPENVRRAGSVPVPTTPTPVPVAQSSSGRTATTFRVGDKTFRTRAEAEAYAKANSTPGTEYQGFKATPSYNFRLEQGQEAVNALAGARGGLFSGRTLQDLTSFNQGLASQEYDNYIARLSGIAGNGMNAATAQGTAATNAAQGVSNALSGIGNAQAAGAIGQGNAISGAINNGIGIWQYMQGQNGGTNGGLTIGRPGSLFGGNSWG